MDFRTYRGDIEWGTILFSVFIMSMTIFFIYSVVQGFKTIEEQTAHRKTFKESCIDAGGYPVSPFDYIKNHGDGYLCINPSAIIEMKEK